MIERIVDPGAQPQDEDQHFTFRPEALDEMEESSLVRDALGDHIFEWFLRNKRAEWSQYQRQVTPFELETYLPNW